MEERSRAVRSQRESFRRVSPFSVFWSLLRIPFIFVFYFLFVNLNLFWNILILFDFHLFISLFFLFIFSFLFVCFQFHLFTLDSIFRSLENRVVTIWVPCIYLKSIVAQGLSISRILSKWPPIEVMQQSHAMRWWDLSFNLSSYGAVLTDKFGCVPYTLHTTHTCKYGLTS